MCDIPPQRATNMIPAHDSPLAALAFDASGTKLATASEKVERRVCVCDTHSDFNTVPTVVWLVMKMNCSSSFSLCFTIQMFGADTDVYERSFLCSPRLHLYN